MTVSLNQLEKAHAALQRAIAVYDRVLQGSDIDLIETTRSGVIQNFWVVYEQSWKVLRRWELLGSDTKFAVVQSTTPSGQAEGLANLGSDPKNSKSLKSCSAANFTGWPPSTACLTK